MEYNTLKLQLKVYFIMGSLNCRAEPELVLEQALKGGATLFQYREKGEGCLSPDQKNALALSLQKICGKNHVPFIINDDIDLMISLNADGLHIGQEDGDLNQIRSSIPDKILGVSVHNVEEAEDALRAGADYLGVGPIFDTSTKMDTRDVMGFSVLKELRAAGITAPIVGIGGISEENAFEVIEAGADGVSVISAISQHVNPEKAASGLLERVEKGLESKTH
ncbi:thiamine phosphate synthase [Fictibacillus sp. KIGAM418]|uniref:Thiamine-phosphate synthase n=1 Tax=Fictibacillus marinisediminis TaxID=2878389 RepID=A0A9X1XBW5_9BACL|nr:thiamine phosphate synthase [Fictibacillus marinisediminis]MCK6256583.1 thiamine phosphate synthase [Fictibacillus marinisediminis]